MAEGGASTGASRAETDETIAKCFNRYDYEARGTIADVEDVRSFAINLCHTFSLQIAPDEVENRVKAFCEDSAAESLAWDLPTLSDWFHHGFMQDAAKHGGAHEIALQVLDGPEIASHINPGNLSEPVSFETLCRFPGQLRISVIGFNHESNKSVHGGFPESIPQASQDPPATLDGIDLHKSDASAQSTDALNSNPLNHEMLCNGTMRSQLLFRGGQEFTSSMTQLDMPISDGFDRWDGESRNLYSQLCANNQMAAMAAVHLGGFMVDVTVDGKQLSTSSAIIDTSSEWPLYWEKSVVFRVQGLHKLADPCVRVQLTGPNLDYNFQPGEKERIVHAVGTFHLHKTRSGVMIPMELKDENSGGCLGIRYGHFPETKAPQGEGTFLPRVQDAILQAWELCHSINPRTQAPYLPYPAATKVACRMLGLKRDDEIGDRVLQRLGAKDVKAGLAFAIRAAAAKTKATEEGEKDGAGLLETLSKEPSYSEPHSLTRDTLKRASDAYDSILKLQKKSSRPLFDRAGQSIRFAGVVEARWQLTTKLAEGIMQKFSEEIGDADISDGVSKPVFVCMYLEASRGQKWHEEVENSIAPPPNLDTEFTESLVAPWFWSTVHRNAHLVNENNSFCITSRQVYGVTEQQHSAMKKACWYTCLRSMVIGGFFTGAFTFLTPYLEKWFDTTNPQATKIHESSSNEMQYWMVMIGCAMLFSILEVGFLYWDITNTAVKVACMAGVDLADDQNPSTSFVASSILQTVFELGYPTQLVHNINPNKETWQIVVMITNLLYKGKSFLLTLISKILVKRLIARASVKLFIPSLDVPIVAAMNYWQCQSNIRQIRLGLILPSPMCYIFNELLGTIPMTRLCREQIVRALGTTILHHHQLNPASQCLLENAWLVCGAETLGSVELDNTELFMATLQKQNAQERQLAVIVFALGMATDGNFDGSEDALMQRALDSCSVSLIPERLNLIRNFVNGIAEGESIVAAELIHILFDDLEQEDLKRQMGKCGVMCKYSCAT